MKENEHTEMFTLNSKIEKLKFVREAKRHKTKILETELEAPKKRLEARKKKLDALKKQSLTSFEE